MKAVEDQLRSSECNRTEYNCPRKFGGVSHVQKSLIWPPHLGTYQRKALEGNTLEAIDMCRNQELQVVQITRDIKRQCEFLPYNRTPGGMSHLHRLCAVRAEEVPQRGWTQQSPFPLTNHRGIDLLHRRHPRLHVADLNVQNAPLVRAHPEAFPVEGHTRGIRGRGS